MSKRLTTQEFINKAIKIHNYKYSYEKVIYVRTMDKVIITCPIHGDFLQTPNSHLNGQGCSKCIIDNKRDNTISFIHKANLKHYNYYDYSKTTYVHNKIKVIIICPIHGEFEQLPSIHLQGHGCKKCGVPGYSKTDWLKYCNSHKNIEPKIYIIRCFNTSEEFVKIGMTTRSVFKRFQSDLPYEYEVIKEVKGSPEFVFDLEHYLHSKYKDFKYLPLILFGGYTECFDVSILKDV